VLLLSTLSSFAWLHYQKTITVVQEHTTCCKQIKSNETIFEVMVKRLIGIA
jgi:hypothetical protein